MRPRKCQNPACRETFVPQRMGQVACSPMCAVEVAKFKRAKEVKKADASKRQALKTRSDLVREAQAAFNAYIRVRDQLAGHPCISSGQPLDWSGNNVDAGHYRSTGAAPHLRFDERNCHAQSKKENRWLAGNAADYRIGLIARIGLAAVEALEADQSERKWSREELIEIRNRYRAKRRELLKGMA